MIYQKFLKESANDVSLTLESLQKNGYDEHFFMEYFNTYRQFIYDCKITLKMRCIFFSLSS